MGSCMQQLQETVRSTEGKCTIKNKTLLKLFLLFQYHWDKAFHFPGKFHFLVKTITDSDRLLKQARLIRLRTGGKHETKTNLVKIVDELQRATLSK